MSLGRPCEIGILFADVVGSTRLYEALGDEAAHLAIEACLHLASRVVLEHGGSVVKTVGDEVMAAFEDGAALVEAAIALQREIDGLAPLTGTRGNTKLMLRVGLERGPAIRTATDYFGTTVNVAARMVGIAREGQIIAPASLVASLPAESRADVRDLDAIHVKGISEPVAVVEVRWKRDTTEMTILPALRSLQLPPGTRDRLKISHGSRLWVLDEGDRGLSLGRELESDVVLVDHSASRRHATIERRRGKWVLADHSTNGTFVSFLGLDEMAIRHEEVILHGAGSISPGKAGGAGPDCVRFAVGLGQPERNDA